MGSIATVRDPFSPNARPASHRAETWNSDAADVASVIRTAGQPVSIKRGHALFSAGDAADSVFVIVSGVMRTSMMLSDGRRQIIGFHEAGDVLGVTFAEQHSISAEGVNATRLHTVSRIWLQGILDLYPHFCLSLLPLATRSMDAARRHLVLLGRMTARERICTFLLERLKGEARIIELAMSRSDIADYLGLTIETVSRTLTQLRCEGVIQAASAREVEVAHRKRLLDCLGDAHQHVRTQRPRAVASTRLERALG
jgi:CRP/FNR family transcriptional regulator, anaerobic regulatory protein